MPRSRSVNLVVGAGLTNQRLSMTFDDGRGLTDQASVNLNRGATLPMVGVSSQSGGQDGVGSGNHGGYTDWDGFRTYSPSANQAYADSTGLGAGMDQPKFLAYSEAGTNLGDTNPNYNTILTHCKSYLDDFYYNGSGQVKSSRWGIKLFWSNGNENWHKGVLSTNDSGGPVSTANINLFIQSQKALYDACHFIDPITGQERYPDAYAGSNPVTSAEQSDLIRQWLHPSARYHDFVVWSFYPPDQGDAGDLVEYDWPSFTESDRTIQPLGYQIRCFYRTKQAEAVVRTGSDGGTPIPNFRLAIACGETGQSYDPRDSTMRPYWAANGMYRGLVLLSAQYDLDLTFACWFDNSTAGRAHSFADDRAGTNPTTATAWHDAPLLCTTFGGVKPSQWAANPKPAWNSYTNGPVF